VTLENREGVSFVNNEQLRNNNKDHVKCFNCGVMGHYANQCDKPIKDDKDDDHDTSNSGGSQG